MPLPDVKSGEDISPAERAKLDKEVEAYALEMEAFWKAKADARDWDSVRANLEVYALAGEKVSEDPRRTEAYRDLVWEGLKDRAWADQARPHSCGHSSYQGSRAAQGCGLLGRRALPGLLSGSLPTTAFLQVRPSPLSPTP